jgi:hypothetical protein
MYYGLREIKNIRVITKLPNSEQSYKGKVKTIVNIIITMMTKIRIKIKQISQKKKLN